jgi:hypothetical protein
MAGPKIKEILSPEARTRRQFGRAGIKVVGSQKGEAFGPAPVPKEARRFLVRKQRFRVARGRLARLGRGARAFGRGAEKVGRVGFKVGKEAIREEQILEKEFLGTPKKRKSRRR